ncbi:MAG: serine/threonine protein kinase [Planctomycetes bacterium]|jgi:hypothetical protein|nr:serine/threonine protein kinase [Planctomycetota bacterium]
MTGDRDEGLGRLAEELAVALAAGEAIAPAAWAERFVVETADVEAVLRALRALDTGLGEELDEGHPELPAPKLPADYELRGELGRGGMGVVYRAHQRSLDREVAIKVLRPGDLVFGDAMRRFRAEAKNLARLRHRHIVSVHDLGESPDGTLWFAMDLIDGGTLADELRRHRRLLPSRAVRIVRQIAAAVVHAHGLGIVHRDLKPQNVLIDRHGDAFVVDFGLARDASAAGARTLTGELLGTPAYMSPEQARGDSARIGEASDVWALGALLYELLTGRSPFAGKPLHETIRAILEDEPVPPRKLEPRVPAELEAVCLQALRKRPEDRYATALAFAEDIERFADGRGVLAKAPSRWAGVGRALQRQRRTLLLVGAAVLATAAAAAFWLPSVRQTALIAEAERLLDGGHPDAAVDSLRVQLATARGDAERSEQLQLLLARAHNDRAAVHLRAGALPAAKAAANEALALATDRVHQGGIHLRSELDQHGAWRWEWARARAVVEAGGRLPQPDSRAVLQARLDAELRSASPANAELAALVGVRFALAPTDLDDVTRLRWIEATVAATGRLLASGEAGAAELFPFHVTGADLDAAWSPAVEGKLAELAVRASRPADRAVAFRGFCQLIGMPVWNATGTVVAPDDAVLTFAANRVVAAWQRWQRLPRAAALVARIELLIEAIEQPGTVLPSTEDRLPTILREWTGRMPPAQDLSAWWRALQAQPFAELLRDGLGLAADTPIDVAAALDSSSLEPKETAMLWRQLAWLQAADGAPLLTCLPRTGDGGWRWRNACLQAAAAADSRPFTVHLAVLRFDDGDPEPRLVGQVAHRATIGAPVEVELDVEHGSIGWFSLRREYEDDGDDHADWVSSRDLRPLQQRPPIGRCRAALRGNLLLDGDGIRLRGEAGLDAAFQETTERFSHGGTALVGLDGAACFRHRTLLWDARRRVTTLLLLVHLTADTDLEPLDLPRWRERAVHLVQSAAAAPPESWRRSAMDWVMPAIWALPEVQAELVALASATDAVLPRVACQLAGAPVAPGTLLRLGYRVPLAVHPVHAALAVHDAGRREALLQQLVQFDATAWTPAIASTLRRGAAERGFALPTQLAAVVDAQPAPDRIVDWLLRQRLHWYGPLVAVVFAVLWHRRREPGMRSQIHFISALILMTVLVQVRIRFAGVVWNPTWLCIGLVLAWCAATSPRWPWFRVLGALSMVAAMIWSLLAWLGHGSIDLAMFVLIPAMILACCDRSPFASAPPTPNRSRRSPTANPPPLSPRHHSPGSA